MRRRLAGDGGFGLVEVLMAGLILVVGIGGGVLSFVTSQKGSGTAERNATATAVGARALEDVRAMPYGAVGTDLTGLTQPLVLDGQTVLSGGMLTTRDGKSEAIVAGTLPAVFDVPVTEGGRTVTYRVYRFVSWRDEECVLLSTVDLVGLRQKVMDLRARIDTLTNDVTGSLYNVLLKLLPGTFLHDQTRYIKATIEHLKGEAIAIVAAIDAVPGNPNGKVNVQIDLCDTPLAGAIPDLSGVAGAEALLTTLNGQLDTLNTEANGLLNQVTTLLDSASYEQAIDAAYGTIQGIPPADAQPPVTPDVPDSKAETTLDALTREIDELRQLGAFPDTKQNTRRVTVGVVNPIGRDGTGPRKVVWMTTVLANPADGLL